jgi:hypothetical protein
VRKTWFALNDPDPVGLPAAPASSVNKYIHIYIPLIHMRVKKTIGCGKIHNYTNIHNKIQTPGNHPKERIQNSTAKVGNQELLIHCHKFHYTCFIYI